MTVNLIFFVSLILAAILVSKVYAVIIKYRTVKKLRTQWGKFSENLTDLETSKLLFDFKEKKESDLSYTIDDDTWLDLDLDEFFKVVNRTVTPIGAQCLYDILRNPLLSQKELDTREKIITTFAENNTVREKIQIALTPLSKPYVKYLVFSLWTTLPIKPKYVFFFYLLSAIAIWVFFLSVLGIIHLGFIFLTFFLNSIIIFLHRKKIAQFLSSFQYLAVLIKTSAKIQSLLSDDLPETSTNLRVNLKPSRSIAHKIFSLQQGDDNPIAAYFNINFLLQLTGFYSALEKIKTNIQNLRNLFEAVGYLDAMISIASYRKQFPNFTSPSLVTDSTKFKVEEIFHPLLVNPIPNEFIFESKNCLVTGSNMSGKSTFLKTIGINSVIAQTFNMSMAKEYEVPFLKVISSIERSDDLISGKSYYMAEVESILRIVNASKTNNVHLFIVDEIFRGTNSVERTAASVEVLKYLVNGKDFTILATHDLQLTEMLNRNYRNYYFKEEMTENGLRFDYKLHNGIATSKNAIALLEYVGYPQSIVDGARMLITNN